MTEGMARVVVGRYRLLRLLGRGGMGAVWRAHDTVLGRDVAIKEIWFPSAGNEAVDPAAPLIRRALREAQAAARLRHPGIVTVHDVLIDEGRPWIVMELINGHSLAQAIQDHGLLTERRTAEIGLHLLDALRAAHHEGVLHRDVKPANILLDAADRVVLTDFGIAAIDDATALTATGQMVGSPAYLAPERINGQPATAAADLWALGVTLYTAVTGSSPFRRDDTQATVAAILTSRPTPPAHAGRLWPVIKGLLAKDPVRRLTAEQSMKLLANVAHPTGSPGPTPRTRAPGWWPARSRGQKSTSDDLPGTLAAPSPTLAAPTAYQKPPGEHGPGTAAPPPERATPEPVIAQAYQPGSAADEPATTLARAAAAQPDDTEPAAEARRPVAPGQADPVETAAAETTAVKTAAVETAQLTAGAPRTPDPARAEPASAKRPTRTVVLLAVLAATAASTVVGAGTLYAQTRSDSAGRLSADPATRTAVTSAAPGSSAVSPGSSAVSPGSSAVSPLPGSLADGLPRGSTHPPPKKSPVPAPFHGRWVGIAAQPMGIAKSWSAVITFTPGSATGKFEAVSLRCKGTLTVKKPNPTDRVLHVQQRTTSDPVGHCADAADLTLIINGVNGIDMFWQDRAHSSNTATATLVSETQR